MHSWATCCRPSKESLPFGARSCAKRLWKRELGTGEARGPYKDEGAETVVGGLGISKESKGF